VSASDFATIVGNTQSALREVGRNLHGKRGKRKRSSAQDAEISCELFLVGLEPGCAQAVMEFNEQAPQTMIVDVGQESVIAFIQGIRQLAKSGSAKSLPRGFSQGVLKPLNEMGTVLQHGIDKITFSSRNGAAGLEASLSKETRGLVRSLVSVSQEVGLISKTGRLEVLDAHNKLAATLYEPDGTKWTCVFNSEELAETANRNWRKTVTVAGKATVEDGKNNLEIDSIQTTDEEYMATYEGQLFPFWESLSLEELARRQQVLPVTDLDELSSLWPEGDDPDKFLDFVLSERSKRRSASDGGGSE
jgi:hypothetical protein